MEPLILVMVLKLAPWLAVGVGLLFLTRSAVGRALAQRIREGSVTAEEVAALAGELEDVRRELGEMQERLDFTERLLAQQRGALPPGASAHDSPTPPELAPVGLK